MGPPSVLPRGGSAIAMAITSLAAIGAIVYSHTSQVEERKGMREGVERDKERLRQKRRMERMHMEQEQMQQQEK